MKENSLCWKELLRDCVEIKNPEKQIKAGLCACVIHWQALQGYKRPRFYFSFSSILMWEPNVQLERCSIE